MTSSRLDPGSISVRPQEPWTFPFYSSMNSLGFKILTPSGHLDSLGSGGYDNDGFGFQHQGCGDDERYTNNRCPSGSRWWWLWWLWLWLLDAFNAWLKSRLGILCKGVPSFEVLMTSGFSSFELDFFLSVAFCVATARSWKERLTESSGIPRYISSSSFLAFANVDKSPMLVFWWSWSQREREREREREIKIWVNIVETKVVGELLKGGKNLRCYIKLPWK